MTQVIWQYLLISGCIAALFVALGLWAEETEHKKLSFCMTAIALIVGLPLFILLGIIEVFVFGFLGFYHWYNKKGK